MPGHYVVTSAGILGPPHTDRTFTRGERVEEKDFERAQPGTWKKLVDRGAVREVTVAEQLAEAAAARAIRERRDVGLGPDATDAEVAQRLAARRGAQQHETARAERIAEAAKMPLLKEK